MKIDSCIVFLSLMNIPIFFSWNQEWNSLCFTLQNHFNLIYLLLSKKTYQSYIDVTKRYKTWFVRDCHWLCRLAPSSLVMNFKLVTVMAVISALFPSCFLVTLFLLIVAPFKKKKIFVTTRLYSFLEFSLIIKYHLWCTTTFIVLHFHINNLQLVNRWWQKN